MPTIKTQLPARAAILALAFGLAGFGLVGATAAQAESKVERGRYLATIMDCGGCHTPGAMTPQPDLTHPLGGSDLGFEIPGLGVFYPPNLTPDQETGLGHWSEAEIIDAVRKGVRPDGRELAPIMPWHSYGALTDADAKALVAYLKSLPPFPHKVPGPFGPQEKPTAPYFTVAVPQ
ncbi:MAG TPA: cytochrome c [Hypericibacter adhaerens]|jgi:mono/diheme cytochrome c family protein|uniref:Cytochrome c n=1 Tax=Hypericibacter adhaerens TaxID=2602016 RepID=A0A5J6MTR5_9PROT|nr:cytochrome c [Hypericibacter adhaerens]QEX21082.1 cytochrome c [Hypericibacter adhaerens]HWA46396.1 cytochrome c [Hypericibacter adhaerens]